MVTCESRAYGADLLFRREHDCRLIVRRLVRRRVDHMCDMHGRDRLVVVGTQRALESHPKSNVHTAFGVCEM